MQFKTFFTAAAMAIGLWSAPSFAATLDVDGSGQLRGAAGVNVGGTLYDVTFREGTCIALFDGCDEASDFTFTTQSAAQVASQALLSQVFIDGPAGNFSYSPSLTYGINSTGDTYVLTPYFVTLTDGPFSFVGVNAVVRSACCSREGNLEMTRDADTAAFSQLVYADWTVATVPLPAGGMLLLSALAGMAALRRRRKSIV